MNRASPALGEAATKLGAGQPDGVPDDPQQGGVVVYLDVVGRAVDGEGVHGVSMSASGVAEFRVARMPAECSPGNSDQVPRPRIMFSGQCDDTTRPSLPKTTKACPKTWDSLLVF